MNPHARGIVGDEPFQQGHCLLRFFQALFETRIAPEELTETLVGDGQVGPVVAAFRFLGGDPVAVLGEDVAKFPLGFFSLPDVEPNLGESRLRGDAVGTELALAAGG